MESLFTSLLEDLPAMQDDLVLIAKFVIGVSIAIAGAAFIRSIFFGGARD